MTAMRLSRNLKEPITRKIVFLVVLFLGALGLLLTQQYIAQVYTSRCQEALDNQHAKRSLGWIIRKRLAQTESTLHQLAAEDDARNVWVLHEYITRRVRSIENVLTVLSNGGVYKHAIRINFESTDEFWETVAYTRDENEGIVLEAIELVPKLVDLERTVEELADAVRKRTAVEDDTNRQALSDRIALCRKQAEATLLRCGEAANKIYRDTSQQLAAIEHETSEVVAHKQLAEYVTAGILGLLCVVVAWITLQQVVGILEERKGLLGDLRKHRDHLDELVTERTAELREANQQLQQEITDRKQVERALRESKERLKAILDTIQTGFVVIDEESHAIVDANPAALAMIGAPKEEVVGRVCHGYICPSEVGRCPISDLGEQVDNSERVLIKADGQTIPVLKTVTRVMLNGRKYLLDSFVDISERKQAEERLRESEERHRVITETAQDAIIAADTKGDIRLWNAAAERTFGFTAAEAIGRNLMDVIVPAQYHEAKRKGLAKFARTGRGVAVGRTLELTALRKDGTEFPIEISVSGYRDGDGFAGVALVRDITERKQAQQELERAHAETKQLLESIPSILIGVGDDERVAAWNVTAERVLGIERGDAIGRAIDDLGIEWDHAAIGRTIAECRARNRPVRLDDVRFKRSDGTEGFLGITLNPVSGGADRSAGLLLVATDISEQKILQGQLAQAQKLESIGQLAAGIAHEINTPIQYVGDNVRFLSGSMDDLLGLISSYRDLVTVVAKDADTEDPVSKAATLERDADLPYLEEELPKSIAQSLDGVARVSKIVRAMKDFSHPSAEGKETVDLNQAIESTITVARNEWKYVAEVVTEFDPALLLVPCLVGDFNQVILNIVINAAHAIADVVGDGAGGKGTITVSTRCDGDWAEVRIRDTGAGIPEEDRSKVFDPFFTTKEVGKGTGQGLSIAHAVITEKHGGTINFETEKDKGTTFVIRLPIEHEAATVEETP